MRLNQVACVRLLSLAICLSLLTACHEDSPGAAQEPSVTSPTETAPEPAQPDPNAAPAEAVQTEPPTSTAAPAGSPANCETCWVHVFDDKAFRVTDDNQVLCGPGAWPSLRNLPGASKRNWSNEIESLKVGPGATVTVWTGEQFTGTSYTFAPGTERMTLKDLPGFYNAISSIEIKCQ